MVGEVDSLGRWLGSKRWLPALYPGALPEPRPRGRCFDVFTGGASIAIHWAKQGRRVVLSDTNPRLIHTLRALRDSPKSIELALRDLAASYWDAYKLGPDAAKARFVEIRERMNESQPIAVESCAGFLFILHAGFNGIYRVNQKGRCNTPMGDPSPGEDLVQADKLHALRRIFRTTEMCCDGFLSMCERPKRGDVVYFDPPYVREGGFVSYSAGGFSKKDQWELGKVLQSLDARGVRWLLSDAATPNAVRTYALWSVREVDVYRSCSGKKKGRGRTRELLVSNETLTVGRPVDIESLVTVAQPGSAEGS